RLAYGLAGLGIFTAIGLIAALTRPTAGPSYAVPVLVGGAAGVLTMVLLVRAAQAEVPVPRPALDPAADDLGWLGQGTGAPELPTGPGADAEAPEPGGSWVPPQRPVPVSAAPARPQFPGPRPAAAAGGRARAPAGP